ncbi:nitroreductase/quinone reductase family protein [Mycolicibacterium mucogenicum]|nr:nitroreductase/quinone reductase family protein [Mycolicibacterium mucogenicum]
MSDDPTESDHVISASFAGSDEYRETMTDVNLKNAEVLRSTGVLADDPFLRDFYCVIVHTVGAQSGAKRMTVIACLPDDLLREGDHTHRLFLFASFAGSGVRPAWYHNIVAHPSQVAVEFNKEYFDVDVIELHGVQRDEIYERMAAEHENFRQYAIANDALGKDPIPVLALLPRDSGRKFHIPQLTATRA